MDKFAQIAAGGIQGKLDLLTVPAPRPLPKECLTLKSCKEEASALLRKMETEDELREALEEKRKWAQPFLEDRAPKLESTRTSQELEVFRYQPKQGAPWQEITIPYYGGPLGAVRSTLETEFELSGFCGRRVFAVIRGADYKAQVYVNGKLAGTHEGFFATFEFDVTELVQEGRNELRIYLDNDFVQMGSVDETDPVRKFGDKIYAATGPGYDDPEIGWHHCPPGMGLLDGVSIETRSPVYLKEVFARTLENEMEFWIEAGSSLYDPQTVSFDISIYGQNFEQIVAEHVHFQPSTGKQLGLGDTFSEVNARREGTLDAVLPQPLYKGQNRYKWRLAAQQLRWWEPQTPWLYQIQVRMLDEHGRVLDTIAQQFGRRTFTQDLEGERKGMFYLNGKPIRLRGANTMGFEQQDVLRRDYKQLVDDILLGKLCNMNFWRLTQRPVQQQIYELCDRLGLLIQTDLPLFGCLHRDKFCEAVRQAEEMERHIRRHPCCILATYINEPFPNAYNAPHMNLDRDELERFFEAADIVVRMNNPDRVIKHVDGDYDPPSKTLPDNHCYPMWYNGHGIDIGRLHKGYWMPVKPDWYYGCGEFGCEGLESWELMKDCYPKSWLPEKGLTDRKWHPSQIVDEQTSAFYHFFYDRPDTVEKWIEESQDFQALATRMMTEAFRRDDRMVTFAIHLFIDAFPSGWMKTIMDCQRRPKKAYFAYRNALEPLMLSLRADKTHFFAGQTAKAEAWVCNDLDEESSYCLRYELIDNGIVIASAEQQVTAGSCTSSCQSVAEFILPDTSERKTLQLRGMLLQNGECAAWNELQYVVFPCCEAHKPMIVRTMQEVTDADLQEAYNGKLLWIDKMEPGLYRIGDIEVCVKTSGMAPMHFASAKTGHPWVQGLQPDDFRHWYSAKEDQIVPLAESTFAAGGDFRTVLSSRNLDKNGTWQEEALLSERECGRGRVILSALSYQQLLDNPAGQIVLSRITAAESEAQP